jgi:glucose/arabinose dehydrogenase
MKRTTCFAGLAGSILAGCGGGSSDAGPDALQPDCDPTTGSEVSFFPVVTDLESPIFMTSPPGDPRLFIVEQGGTIKVVKDGVLLGTPFLEIEAAVVSGGEQGLLGLAFHPDYPADPRFFIYYTAQSSPEGGGAAVIAEYRVSDDPDVADAGSEDRLLQISDFAGNHNGGMLAFGADGYLYIGTGDGGGGGDNDDPQHPNGHGQDETTLLGDMLRIDVSAPGTYAIPSDNPFADSPDGPNDPRPEIWAIGLRNPWRFSFDRMTGDLYIGDVGQGSVEEVDFYPAGGAPGANFGWREMEGTSCFDPTDCNRAGKELPISEYNHANSRSSVTGGYVYRGSCMPDLQGTYVFGDYGSGEIWGFKYTGTPNNSPPLLHQHSRGDDISSFGEDATGELYFTAHSGTLFRMAPAN